MMPMARRQLYLTGVYRTYGQALLLLHQQHRHQQQDQFAESLHASFTFSIVNECAGNV